MKRVLPFPRMAKCLHCTRERVERVWGRRAGRITFKRQKKERNSFISLVEPGMFLGPCLGPFSFLTRTAALRNSPHAEYQDDDPASIFEELQFSLLAKLFFFCLSNPEEQVGEQGGLGRIKTAAGPPAGDRKEKCPQLPKQRYSALSLLSHPLANSHPQDNGSQHHLGTSPGLGLPPPQQCGSYLLTSTAPKPSPTGEKTAAPFLSLCPPLP